MITAGRALVEDTFIDECTITRPASGSPSLNLSSGVLTPAVPATVHSGRCRVKNPSRLEREHVFGDDNVTTIRRLVNLPSDAAQILKGDIFTATASLDGEVLRAPMRVLSVNGTSTLMFRQLGVELIDR